MHIESSCIWTKYTIVSYLHNNVSLHRLYKRVSSKNKIGEFTVSVRFRQWFLCIYNIILV